MGWMFISQNIRGLSLSRFWSTPSLPSAFRFTFLDSCSYYLGLRGVALAFNGAFASSCLLACEHLASQPVCALLCVASAFSLRSQCHAGSLMGLSAYLTDHFCLAVVAKVFHGVASAFDDARVNVMLVRLWFLGSMSPRRCFSI